MLLSLIALTIGLSSAAPASVDPADLKEFGLICFCTSRVATPHRLVSTGNNGRVLLLARRGLTKSQIISAGEPATRAQLAKLRKWGLLSREGGRYKTAFPILGSAEMAALRNRLSPLAARLAVEISPNLRAVQDELRKRGQEQSGEAVLFAYILDGLTWRALDAAHTLPSQKIDAQHPYWNGTFWAVYPKQDNMPGTNSQSIGNTELRMMWTPPLLPWFERLRTQKTIPNGVEVREPTDPIYVCGREVANSIAVAVTSARLDDVITSANAKQRILIATHELIWMLLDRANKDLGLRPPRVLETGAKSLGEVTPLIVLSVKASTP